MNILASTSRQWNCGDEFILFGCRQLIDDTSRRKNNWMIYDRNPDVLRASGASIGNSWRNGLKGIDLVVFAGTPEWSGANVRILCESIVANNTPAIYLGIGSCGWPIRFTDVDLRCLASAKLIVCRDEDTQRQLAAKNIRSVILPCPAMFAVRPIVVNEGGPIGVTLQITRTTNQNVQRKLADRIVKYIELLLTRGEDVAVIAHYRDEYLFALKRGWPVRYSFDAADYPAIYAYCRAVVSTRLHGAILAHAMGIPTALLNHDARSLGAIKQFPGIMRDVPTTWPQHCGTSWDLVASQYAGLLRSTGVLK